MDAAPEASDLETDPRFPSGPWIGFYLQKARPGKHQMELDLSFAHGKLWGSGRDIVGAFILRGQYDLKSNKCHWSKKYLGKHDVHYDGFNEGKGIWGTWEMPPVVDPSFERGGFHIWPKAMGDPTTPADWAAVGYEETMNTGHLVSVGIEEASPLELTPSMSPEQRKGLPHQGMKAALLH